MTEKCASPQAQLDDGRAGTQMCANDAINGSDGEMNSFDLIILLARYKKILLTVTIAVAVVLSIVCALIPATYTATSTILPPLQTQSAGAASMGQLQTLTGLPAATSGIADPTALCIAMLKSRSVRDAIVNQFDLRRVYSVKQYEEARIKLDRNGEILADKEGQISISVSDRDPRRAVEIANAYVEQLRSLYRRLADSKTNKRKTFYEKQLAAERRELSTAELSLRDVQENTSLVQPDAQIRAIIDADVSTHSQIASAEAKLEAMRLWATPGNPDLQRAQAETAALGEQLAKLERSPDKLGNGNVEIPVRQLPQAETEYVRRARNLKYHEAFYDFLVKQWHAARLDEGQDGAVVEVIDEAAVPDARSGPPRLTIVLVAAMVAFCLSCLWVTILEAIQRRKRRLAFANQCGDAELLTPPRVHEETVPFSPAIPGSAIELGVLSAIFGLGILAYLLGWLSPEQAAGSAAIFLSCVCLLAWRNFDQGRHPCFLFLCVLTLLQSGRSVAFLLGDGSHPMRIAGIAPHPFDLTRSEAGTTLLCLALSALCIYGVCRWNYRRIAPPVSAPVERYLPFLYIVFYGTVLVQLYKNYSYYAFVQHHGGYLYLWTNRSDIVSSVPFLVRAIVLINAPAFLAIFVFEKRKKWLYLATVSYFVTSSIALLIGYRSGVFALVLVLWYVAKIKSATKSRKIALVALAIILVVIGNLIQLLREDSQAKLTHYDFAPLEFIRMQGNSIDVTAVAIKYEKMLAPHAFSYAWYDLQGSFVLGEQQYVPGQFLTSDVSVLLNPVAFSRGLGDAGSYLAEMYLLGGVAGVIALSLLLGGGLHLLYRYSCHARSLFVVASILPAIILMPRGQLLGWASDLVKTGISLAILWFGWLLYCTILWLAGSPVLRSGATDA
jgi:tyrosine-protein kinase Etk/Wzc